MPHDPTGVPLLPRLVARRLTTTQVVVCASPAYLDEHGEPESPEDLATHDCLIYTYSSTANVWRFTARDGREIPVAVSGGLRANNGIALAQAAIAGHGVLMSPTFYVGAELRAKLRERVPAERCEPGPEDRGGHGVHVAEEGPDPLRRR